MAISQKLRNAIKSAIIEPGAINEIVTILNTAGAGSAQAIATTDSPTFAALTITNDATVGGYVKSATGKGLKVNGVVVVTNQQTKITPVAITPGTGSLPTADGALAISNTATPTVVELLEAIVELKANIVSLQTILTAHGLTN